MSEIRVYPGLIIDGDGSKVIFTLTPIIGETREAYEQRCQEVFKLAVSFVAPSSPTFEVGDTSKYRKVGEHAYEIITPGYAPQEEAGNERDSHFAGFAKLLTQELQQEGLLGCWNPDFGELDQEKVQQATRLIARRAYDLVYSAIEFMRYSPYRQPMDVSSTEVWIRFIPDMDKWPK